MDVVSYARCGCHLLLGMSPAPRNGDTWNAPSCHCEEEPWGAAGSQQGPAQGFDPPAEAVPALNAGYRQRTQRHFLRVTPRIPGILQWCWGSPGITPRHWQHREESSRAVQAPPLPLSGYRLESSKMQKMHRESRLACRVLIFPQLLQYCCKCIQMAQTTQTHRQPSPLATLSHPAFPAGSPQGRGDVPQGGDTAG